jgi:hypothetical protein
LSEFKGVVPKERPVIEAGIYNATLTSFSDVMQGRNGEFVFWRFTPDGYDDVEVAIITSLSDGRNTKGMEIARRIQGKSSATDTKWGKDIRDKRPVVNWGPQDVGSRATIVVEKIYDDDSEAYENRVTNVVAEGALEASRKGEEDFADINMDDVPEFPDGEGL